MRRGPLTALLVGLFLLAGTGFARADDDKKTDENKMEKKSDEKSGKPGFLGVHIRPGEDGQVVVEEVEPNSPADKAGLKSGDVIVRVAKKEVKDPDGLREMIGGMKAGEKVSIDIKRDGKEQTIDVTLAERPEQP